MASIKESLSGGNKSTQIIGDKKDYGVNIKVTGNLLVISKFCNVVGGFGDGQGRKSITAFSPSSGARMRRYLRECVSDYITMVTLTYPCGDEAAMDGRKSKDDLRRFIQELKRYWARNGADPQKFSVFWFMEFQANGSIHYHMFCTQYFPKEWIASTWFTIVGSEDARHLAAGTRIEKLRAGRAGTISYASKYAVKSEQKVIPEQILSAGRFWGVCGNRLTVAASISVSAEAMGGVKVAAKLEKLKVTINDLMREKKLTKLKTTNDNVQVWVITGCKEAKTTLETAIYRLMNVVYLSEYDPITQYNLMDPELREDICL